MSGKKLPKLDLYKRPGQIFGMAFVYGQNPFMVTGDQVQIAHFLSAIATEQNIHFHTMEFYYPNHKNSMAKKPPTRTVGFYTPNNDDHYLFILSDYDSLIQDYSIPLSQIHRQENVTRLKTRRTWCLIKLSPKDQKNQLITTFRNFPRKTIDWEQYLTPKKELTA